MSNQYSKKESSYINEIFAAMHNKTLVPFMLYDYQHIPWKTLAENDIAIKRFSSKGDFNNVSPGENAGVFDEFTGYRSSGGLSKDEKGDQFIDLIDKTLNNNSVFLPYTSIKKLHKVNAGLNFINDESLIHLSASKAEFSELISDSIKQLDWIPLNTATFDLLSQFAETPHGAVLRPDNGQGGRRIFLLRNDAEIQDAMHYIMTEDIENQNSYYFSAYIPSHPISASACVFADGSIKVYPACYQLIGNEQCGNSPFKYCGGDFSAAKFLSHNTLLEIENAVVSTGQKLHELGFLGVFGVDFILDYYEQLFYIETNLRFVSPNYLVEEFSHSNGICDPFLDHLAAFLEIKPGELPSLNDWKSIQCGSQVLLYNKTDNPMVRILESPDLKPESITHPLLGLTDHETPIAPSALLSTIRTYDAASLEGRLLPNIENAINKIVDTFEVKETGFDGNKSYTAQHYS
jgi:predicted ATP-grasp superfamily ATP-dependent carboligase